MNKATTKGFEKDVGNKTTHHFLYPESAVDIAPGVSLVLLPFKLRDLEWLASALSTGTVKMYDLGGGSWPSGGGTSTALLTSVCVFRTYMRVKERVEADKDKVRWTLGWIGC